MSNTLAAEATSLDLDAVQRRFADYRDHQLHAMARQWSCCSAHGVADKAPALLGAVDTLASALAALLALIEQPTTGEEQKAAVERARAALATVTPTTGGAA